MAILTVSDLQDLSVRCTTQFLTNGTPLNQLLAKEAADRGLNQEQLKRSVEAVNTLAYLKTLEKAGSDRTPEFRVADYHEILKLASIPEVSDLPFSQVQEDPWLAFLSSGPQGQTKQASESESFVSIDMTNEEALSNIVKQASINARQIEELQVETAVLMKNLVKAASDLSKDSEALFKLSSVTSGETFTKLARLVFKEDKSHKDLPESLFKQAQLTQAKTTVSLFKEACEKQEELSKRVSLQKKAEEFIGVEKQAFLGAIVRGIASAAKNSAHFVAGTGPAKPILGGRMGMLGKGIGSSAAAIAKAPLKPIGRAVDNVFKEGTNKLAESGVGKVMAVKGGQKIEPVLGTKAKIIGGAVMTAGGAAGDAMMYTPKTNPITGEGGDVWSKLQG